MPENAASHQRCGRGSLEKLSLVEGYQALGRRGTRQRSSTVPVTGLRCGERGEKPTGASNSGAGTLFF
jgi:hypothetical protein